MNLRARTRLACTLLALLAAACSSRSLQSEPDAAVAAQSDAGGDAATSVDASMSTRALPAAFKGYELYAWDEGDELVYTLVTGTNRQKTLAEITVRDTETQDGDWVFVSGHGLASLERTLARVPAGSSVILTQLEGLPALSPMHRDAITDLLPR